MPEHDAAFGNAVGPFGFPMPDKQARVLDTLLKSLPKTKEYEFRHALTTKAPTELNPGERSDVSWISTESVDRMGEVVVARGMNDSQFQGNPLVTLGHAYWMPPVGKSLWRKRVKDGELVGIKAKTQYPSKPASWPEADPWPPDQVLSLIQAGLLQGKSIGFLPTKVHIPDEKEVKKNDWPNNVGLVIDEWLLLEYACVFLPANQDALVEAVSKGMDVPATLLAAMGVDADCGLRIADCGFKDVRIVPLAEIEKALVGGMAGVDLAGLAEKVVREAWERVRGRV